jgi:tetratricopeptide (TPR) repeat protein
MNNSAARRDWKKKESFASVLAQLLAVAVVLGAGLSLFSRYAARRRSDSLTVAEAQKRALAGDASSLKRAALSLNDISEASALQGWILTLLWLESGDATQESGARAALSRAQQQNQNSEARFATEAYHLVADKKPGEAVALLEQLRRKGAGGAKLYYVLGRAYQALGNLTLARTCFAAAVEKSWREARYHWALGEHTLLEGNTGALENFEKALRVNPLFEEAKEGRRLAQVRAPSLAAQKETATTSTEPALRARALAIEGLWSLRENKPEEAGALAAAALKVVKNEPWAMLVAAKAAAAATPEKSEAEWRRLIDAHSTVPVFYFEAAEALQKTSHSAAALELMSRYEALFGAIQNQDANGVTINALTQDDRYWLQRGSLLKDMGKTEEALQSYDRAIAVQRFNRPRALFEKATLLLSKKDFEMGERTLSEVTPPDGSGPIAEAYLALSERNFAKSDWSGGCQNAAFALSRLKSNRASPERLKELIDSVSQRLKAAGQGKVATLWAQEAQLLAQ